MAKMFTPGFKPKSTSKKAKSIIRSEIMGYFAPSVRGGKSTISNMKLEADSYDGGFLSRYPKSDYTKGAGLVDGGCFACYYSDQMVMLSKIYGKKTVESWSEDKIHATYKHLIGREYAAMLQEQAKKKQDQKAKKPKKAKKAKK